VCDAQAGPLDWATYNTVAELAGFADEGHVLALNPVDGPERLARNKPEQSSWPISDQPNT